MSIESLLRCVGWDGNEIDLLEEALSESAMGASQKWVRQLVFR